MSLCFLKFLLCYALIPSTKPIMFIIFVPIMLSISLNFSYKLILVQKFVPYDSLFYRKDKLYTAILNYATH